MMLTIRSAHENDVPAMQHMLEAANLPADDLQDSLDGLFVAERRAGESFSIEALGGYERIGKFALLRSFVTSSACRGLGIGQKLLGEVTGRLQKEGISDLYLLTSTAAEWFARCGFSVVPRATAPEEIRHTRQFSELCPDSATLMYRSLVAHSRQPASDERSELFDAGYYCAEASLLQITEHLEIESPLVPAIATGFCSGVSRTGGMCGALTGGILGLNLVYGRDRELDSVEQNYKAVQQLVEEYEQTCGSTRCNELLGCHLGTIEGQQHYRKNNLHERCTRFTAIATEIAIRLSDPANIKKR